MIKSGAYPFGIAQRGDLTGDVLKRVRANNVNLV